MPKAGFLENNSPERFKDQHGYMIEGLWYPRVTSIVEIKAKPALYWFYGQAASFSAANEVKSKSAEEGTLVHNLLEKIVRGEQVVVPEEYQALVDEFQRLQRERDFFTRKEWVEKRIRNREHHYAGTFDMLAEIDGKFAIVDIKTSAAIYRDYSLQTAAYLEAVNAEPWVFGEKNERLVLQKPIETRFIIRVGRKKTCERCGAETTFRGGREKILKKGEEFCSHQWGSWQGICDPQEFHLQENDFRAFLACKTLWEWENEAMLGRLGYF